MNDELMWFEPFRPRLPLIIKKIRRNFWINFVLALIFVGLTYYPFNVFFYQNLLLNHGTTNLNIAFIYGGFGIQRIIVTALLAEVFASVRLTRDLRDEMNRKLIGVLGIFLLIISLPFFVLAGPIGYAVKKIWIRRFTRTYSQAKRKGQRVPEKVITINPRLAHEYFVIGQHYLRGNEGYVKNLTKAVKNFKIAAQYGHFLATYHLAKIFAKIDSDYLVKPNYRLAEKYLLKCFQLKPGNDKDGAKLYYLYALLLAKINEATPLNRDDLYLILTDILTKAKNLGHPQAEQKLIELQKHYHYLNPVTLSEALQKEPFNYLLNEYMHDLKTVNETVILTPSDALKL